MFLPRIYRIQKNLNFCFKLTVILIHSEANTIECIFFFKNQISYFLCVDILSDSMCFYVYYVFYVYYEYIVILCILVLCTVCVPGAQ